jgi:hypothetical protein
MEDMMNVKDYQNLPVNEPKKIDLGEMFRPKVNFNRIAAGKLVPIYKIINVKKTGYEFIPKQIRLI